MCHMEVHCYSCNHFYAYKACCVRYQEPDHQEPPARTYLVPGLCLICRQPPTKVNLKKRSLLLTVQQMEIIMDIPHTAEGFLDSVARFYLRGDHDRWSQPGYVRPRDPRQVMAEEEYLKSLEVSHGVDTDNDNTAAAAAVGSGPGAECDRGFANMHASSSFGHSILSSEPGRVYPLYEPDTDIQPWLPVEVRSTATGQARLVTGDNNDHTQRVGSMVAGSLLEDWGMTAEVVHPSARREDAGEANGNQNTQPGLLPSYGQRHNTTTSQTASQAATTANGGSRPYNWTPAFHVEAPTPSETPQDLTSGVTQNIHSPIFVTASNNLAHAKDDPFFDPRPFPSTGSSSTISPMSTNPFISHSIPTAKQDTPATPAMSPHGSLTGSPMGSSTRPAWIRQPPELEDYWNELYSAPSSTTSTPTHRHNRESFTMASPTATARARRSGEIRHGKRPIGGRPLPSPAVTDIDRPANDAGANHPMSSELIPKPEPQRKRARFVRFQDEVTPQSAVGSGSAGFNFGYSGSAVGEVEKANGSPIGVGSSASASASGSGDKQGEGSAGVNGDLIDKESDAQRDELQWIYQCHLHDQEERQRMEHEKAHDKAQNEALFNALANALNHCSGDLSKEDEDVDMEDEDVEMQ